VQSNPSFLLFEGAFARFSVPGATPSSWSGARPAVMSWISAAWRSGLRGFQDPSEVDRQQPMA